MRIVRGLFSYYTGKGLSPAGSVRTRAAWKRAIVPSNAGCRETEDLALKSGRREAEDLASKAEGAMELEFVIVIIRKGRING